MTISDFLSGVAELILESSNIGAEPEDELLFEGLEEVMEDVGPLGTESVTLLFTDGRALRVRADWIE